MAASLDRDIYMKTKILVVLGLLMAAGAVASAQDLSSMNIEQLMQVEVTSVSKTKESLARSAVAIYVITQEDIRRSGATSVPELLRMVPGMDVAQIDASTWAVSARGFNSQYANEMLVLVDGCIVYSPSFSGVVWDAQDLVLDDIERIEVIRGPGATLWGSNAVNGVINIITKKAQATQGGFISVESRNQDLAETTAQYGGNLAGKGYYRIFAKYFDRGAFDTAGGQNAADGWHQTHTGFRTDWNVSGRDSLTVQGDFFYGPEHHTSPLVVSLQPPVNGEFNVHFEPAGGNILGRWNHTYSPHSDITLQIHFDVSDRDQYTVSEHRHITDVEFQNHIAVGSRQNFVWGVGYRYEKDRLPGSLTLTFSPQNSSVSRYSSFLQDEISLWPDRLRVTLGTRLEHDPYTGFNVQPDVCLLWSPVLRQAIWAAFSRPVRTPSRADIGARYILSAFPGPGGLPAAVTSYGNPNLGNEAVTSFQAGYRAQLRDSLRLDVAAFHSRYSQIPSSEPQAPFIETNPMPPHWSIPVVYTNAMSGTTDGVELGQAFSCDSSGCPDAGDGRLHSGETDQGKSGMVHCDHHDADFGSSAGRCGPVPRTGALRVSRQAYSKR
jgi:iron complex outermembrane receptor protein